MVRAVLSVLVLVVAYFLAPLERLWAIPFGISLGIAAAVLLGFSAWEIRAISRSPHPALRGVGALAVTVPLYLLFFAAAYFVLASTDPANFDVEGLTRIDTLYFTVTTFSSVGFGDISAASQNARVLVTVQMLLNLLVLGVGIRVFVGVVRRSRRARSPGERSL